MAHKKNSNAKKPASEGGAVEAVKHKNKRANIPTRGLRGFVEGDENRPKTTLYARPVARSAAGLEGQGRAGSEGWSSLYSTKSRPFDRPQKGKIAIKVINHYGDEVLKVYSVS